MKHTLLAICLFVLFAARSFSQCPSPGGMVATSLSASGSCFLFVQFAIPNSNVSLYNAGGYVTQGVADASGIAVIPYPCASNPIINLLSLNLSNGTFCSVATISAPITLPVKISAFTGELTSSGVLLKWATSYELNNEKYVIQKSTNGTEWTDIGEVAGASGLSLALLQYSFRDEAFVAGDIAYYRLKQLDIDGTIAYSKAVYVNDRKNATTKLSIFPNPFQSDIQLKGIAAADVNTKNIFVYNISGQTVSYRITGSNALTIDPAAPAGIYLLKIKDQTFRLIKH